LGRGRILRKIQFNSQANNQRSSDSNPRKKQERNRRNCPLLLEVTQQPIGSTLGVAGAEKKKTIPQSGKTLANPGKQRSWPLEDDVEVFLVFIRPELFCKKCPDGLILAAICNP
jgi:hypothetical protein